jgi:hypothetical protein
MGAAFMFVGFGRDPGPLADGCGRHSRASGRRSAPLRYVTCLVMPACPVGDEAALLSHLAYEERQLIDPLARYGCYRYGDEG